MAGHLVNYIFVFAPYDEIVMKDSIPIRLTETFQGTKTETYGFLGLGKKHTPIAVEKPLMMLWGQVHGVTAEPDGRTYIRFTDTDFQGKPRERGVHVKETPEQIDKIVTAKLREIYGPK